LIGGDHNTDTLPDNDEIVPARYLTSKDNCETEGAGNTRNWDFFFPSDLYYSQIHKSFDSDGDGRWGEPNNDSADTDLEPDLCIGRVSAGSEKEVSNYIRKILYYNSIKEKDKFLKKCLMVSECMGGGILNPEFGSEDYNKFDESLLPPIRTMDYLFDSEWWWKFPFFKGWPDVEIKNRLNDEQNIIIHNGHGAHDESMKLNNEEVAELVNKKLGFLYNMGCNSGAFDNWYSYFDADPDYKKFVEDDCSAEYWTVKTIHGAFATIQSTGHTHRAINPDYLTAFFKAFDDARPTYSITIGEAFLTMKSEMYKQKTYIENIYGLTLFGDPTMLIKKYGGTNNPPNLPATPEISTYNNKYKLYTSTYDIEGDKISYKWKLDENECTYWTRWYNSNETANFSIFVPYGNHQVCVKSRDVYLNESGWSNPINITSIFDVNIQTETFQTVLQKQVKFTGQASGGTEPYTTWYYDFGDGNNSQLQNPSHTYGTLGTYNVTLNVTDSQNISSNISKIINVVLLNADFESSQGIAVSNEQETFNFNDKSKGYYDIVNWSWNFGDGNTSFQRNTSHVYSSEGAYNVSLTVTDNQSNNDTAYLIIYIDSVSPTISSVYNNFDIVGYGSNVIISVNTSDNSCGIKNVKVNITYPDSSFINCSMNYTVGSIYEYVFSDCWQLGEYSYDVWVADQADNNDSNSTGSFVVSRSFGYNKIGDSNQTIWDTITGSVFGVNEKSVADNISVYLDPGNASSDYHYRCVIYSHNGSELIGISEEKNISDEKGWQTFNFSVPKPVLLNDTDYVIGCWSDNYTVRMYYDDGKDTESYYNDGKSTLQGHYFEGLYKYTPDPIRFESEDRKYSIYCCYTPDNTSPEITNVSNVPDTIGFGFNITITADIFENQSGVDIIQVNMTYPNSTQYIFNMNHFENDTYNFVFNDTWLKGQYNYSIWTVDYANNSNISDGYSFNVSGQATISVCTINNSYTGNCTVNLTDPPSSSYLVGYEFLDEGEVLHIWNNLDHYYFDTDSGIQLTNHYNEYWSHNVLMLGYYNNDEWNLIYRTDELSGFNNNIESDNETYVNATLWKNLNYAGYDFRLAIRYHLGIDDNELTVIPYIKNIGDEDIPYTLGFAWEIKDIQIDMTEENDYIDINGTTYYLNISGLNETYTNMDIPSFYIKEDISDTKSESLYLRWDENLNYTVQVKSRTGQYNAPVTLGIKIGTLDVGQEKSTELFWHDATEVIYYFNDYDPMISWATNPAYMVDGNTSNYASTTIDRDMEKLDIILDSSADKGAISKVEIRAFGKYSGSGYPPHDIVLKTVGGTHYFIPGTTGAWSSWYDITNNPNAPDPWTWTDIDNLIVEVEAATEGAYTLYCSKVDVRVTYNPNPVISNPYPSSGSKGIMITPVLNITVSDPEGDTMNITWLSNSSGSWQVFGTNFSVGNGTYHQMFSNATVNGQWWYWKINVSDGTNTVTSNVFSFYTGYQSKIENTGSTNFTGYLLMQIEYYNTTNSTWILEQVVVNESTPRTINAGCTLALDTIFNPYNVSTSSFTNGDGTYRVYAAFRDPDGDVLVCDDETLLEDSYQFTVSTS
jgi:chitodextrinase